MKRSGPPARKKPLKRGRPPARRKGLTSTDSLTRGQALTRTDTLRPESTRRQAERPERAAVRTAALEAAGYRCTGADIVPEVRCFGGLDVDEITPRGVRPGAHLEQDQTQILCRGHHDWKHAHPVEAQARGLRLWSWETECPTPTPGPPSAP